MSEDEKLDPLAEWGYRNPSELLHTVDWYRQLRLQLAREDPNEFVEYVIRHEATNEPVKQSAIHEKIQNTLSDNNRCIVWAHIEAGKAVPLTTPIPTPTGWATMGELKIGDRVYDRRGYPCKVTWCSPVQYERDVFKISFDDGTHAFADRDHRWLAWSMDDIVAKRPLRVVTTGEMLARVRRAGGDPKYHANKWKIPVTGAVQFSEKELLIHPYVLGAWLGDGTSANAHITNHDSDRQIIDECGKYYQLGTPRSDKRSAAVKRWLVGPGKLRGQLGKLNLLNNKHIPTQYMQGSVPQRLDLLAGILDTDGTVDKKGRVELCLCNERLANDSLELIRSLGFKASMHNAPAKLHGRVVGIRYRINFSPKTPVFRLKRKLARQNLTGQNAWHRSITAIEAVDSVPVKCITVDSADSSYLMDHCFTVTHNTTNVSIARALYEIGKNPNIRIAILSATMRQSQKILRVISQYIERPGPLHEVFPHLRPGRIWNATSISVEREGNAKDPTVQALGAGVGSVLGARLDLVIIDDILNIDNTRTEQMRQNLWEWYASNVAGRLIKTGRIWVVGTAFHPDDLLHRLAKNPQFKWVRFPIIDELGRLSWPEQWPLERIKAKEIEVGPHEAARQLYCRALDDTEARFKREWLEACMMRGIGKKQAYALHRLPPGYKTFTGVDLGVRSANKSDLTVLFTIILHPNGDREVLAIESGRWSGPDIMEHILDTHRRFQSTIIVENNQAQQFIVDFVKANNLTLPIKPFTTGRNKHHVEYGVESLATELSKAQWIIPSVDGLTPSSKEISAWISELLFYSPSAHTGDRVMASWIAREGARAKNKVIQVGRYDTISR